MALLIIYAGSFLTALGIAYLGVATEQGVKKVADTEVGAKVGRWLLLLPVLDAIGHFLSLAPDILSAVGRLVGGLVVIAIIFALLFVFGGFLLSALGFIALYLLQHPQWLLFLAFAVSAVVYLVRR